MPLIFSAELEKNPMKLLDMVFGERDLPIRRKDHFHKFGVTRDLLLIPRPEREGFHAAKQRVAFVKARLRLGLLN